MNQEIKANRNGGKKVMLNYAIIQDKNLTGAGEKRDIPDTN
jgi:hypothetical protein